MSGLRRPRATREIEHETEGAMLGALGLTADAESVYIALVRRGPLGRRTLGTDLALSASRVAEALGSLERLGLVHGVPDDPDRVRPAPPAVALGALAAEHRHELGQAEVAIARLAEAFHRRGLGDPSRDILEVVTGAAAVAQRVQQIERAAVREVCMFVTGTVVALEGAENSADGEALSRGVGFRVVVDGNALQTEHGRRELRTASEHGMRIRAVDGVPAKLLLADESVAIVPLVPTSDDREPGVVVIHGSALLTLLTELFDAVWERALPMTRDGSLADELAIDDVDRRLLGLLLAGFTDAAVARQLALSERTVQRRLRALMRLVGATSRLQLGWQAHRRGLITTPATAGPEPSDRSEVEAR